MGDLLVQWAPQEGVAQDLVQMLGHDRLLLHTAVVLQGQNDREVRGLNNTTHRKAKRESHSISLSIRQDEREIESEESEV